MPTATITVGGIKAPEPGKKRGRIIAKDGTIFQIDPILAEGIKLDNNYSIDYTDEEFRNAKYRVVQGVHPVSNAVQHPPHALDYPLDVSPPAPKPGGFARAASPGSPIPMQAVPQPTYAKDEMIFVCGAINHSLQHGQLELSEDRVEAAVNVLRRVWAKTFAKGPMLMKSRIESGLRDALDDEIPEMTR